MIEGCLSFYNFVWMIRILITFSIILTVNLKGNTQPLFRKALFLGNSYTYVNNLPALTAALAHSAGDSLFFESNAPGGYTLGWQPIAHATDATSLQKIRSGSWDFVVLQEQSQTPAIPVLRDSCMFPGSIALHDSVKLFNPCARVLFYLTWGRRFGGIQCFVPNYCSTNFVDFDQMQDSLTKSYKLVADSLKDWIAPVGEAWRYVIHHYGMVLHADDFSHPNIKGSYLAACVFYSSIFRKHATGLTFYAGLTADTAQMLQKSSDSIVFGHSSSWNLDNDQPVAAFVPIVLTDTLKTINQSQKSVSWSWDFGDGGNSRLFQPVHIYNSTGLFNVKLSACDSCRCDTVIHEINIVSLGNPERRIENRITLIYSSHSNEIIIKGFTGKGEVDFYDVSGRKIQTVAIENCKGKIQPLPDGIYFWKLTDCEGRMIKTGNLVRICH